MSDRWRLCFDDDNLDDEYDERPSEFLIRQCQRAAPDAWTRLYRLVDGWKSELVDERPPIDGSAR